MVNLEDCKKTLGGSRECDPIVQAYCNNTPTDLDFCGCSTNALNKVTDPKLGESPVRCWANSCNKNANAYQFAFTKDLQCPNICVDNSTITALGSNITDSTFSQSSCGGEIKTDNKEVEKTLATWQQYGMGFGIAILVILLCMSMSISSIFVFK